MEMAGGGAQSAVDSLLGRLSSALVEEAKLLRGVHGDMQFIKREMESMNGFLLDASPTGGGGPASHQVRAWTRQVHELAYDSQSCVDRYVQTFGGSRPSAGLLASVRQVPKLVRTIPDRHRIAAQIRELKSRALEVGERRQRYGVAAAETTAAGGVVSSPSSSATAVAKEEAEDARRRNALACADFLFDIDVRVDELVAWLRGGPVALAARGGGQRRNQVVAIGHLLHQLVSFHGGGSSRSNVAGDLAIELMKLLRGLFPGDNPDNVAEAAAFLKDEFHEAEKEQAKHHKGAKDRVRPLATLFLDMLSLTGHKKEPSVAELLEMAKAQTEPMEVARAEGRYMAAQMRWLAREFEQDLFHEQFRHEHRPKFLAIVTPPAQDAGDDPDQELLHDQTINATELARKVYYHPGADRHFDVKVWVDAKLHSQRKERLQFILRELLQHNHHSIAAEGHANAMATASSSSYSEIGIGIGAWKESRLEEEIKRQLRNRRFLIVLADPHPKEEHSLLHILPALPDHADSAAIVTPSIQHMAQFHGWYMASWVFLAMGASRYQVHFCSNLLALRKIASQLASNDELRGSIVAILKKCHWDSFATKMFLHALYANPRRSKEELDRLLQSLRQSSRVGNARRMIMFCYDDLPSQYQSCLLSVSMFPPGAKIKKTSLVRRWAAESFVTGRDGATAVDEAERCFDALVARGLLHPDHVGPAGKVKSCTVHHHVLSFLTKTATSTDDGLDLPPDLAHRISPRRGIQLLLDSQQAAAMDSSTTRWGGGRRRRRRGGPDVSSKDMSHDIVAFLNLLPTSSDHLGLIKVLDLQGCKGLKQKRRLRNICNNIFQLKYLSLRDTDAVELPNEISKLRYLETLDIRQTLIQSFPSKTISLPKLMHLLAGHFDHQADNKAAAGTQAATESDKPFSTVHLPRGLGSMTNLLVASHVEVSAGDEDLEELTNVGRKLQLRKLGVVIRGDKEEAHILQVLLRVVGMLNESLCSLSIRVEAMLPAGADVRPRSKSKEGKATNKADGGQAASSSALIADDMGQSPPRLLESLNIKGKISGLPAWIKMLHRLSKVTLCCTHLTESDIEILGELLNLRCIRLLHQSYTQKKLTLDNKKFKKLELLVIQGSDISTILFDEDAAPRLKKIAWTFTTVEIVLFGISKLPNLKQIEINGTCDPYHLGRIAQDIKANPSHPVLIYNTTSQPTAASM